ncbi:MAG: TPR repeat protein [Myxococcota bacterium]
MLLQLVAAALAAPPPPVAGLTLPPERACLEAPTLESVEATGSTGADEVSMAATAGLSVRQIKASLAPFYRHLDACGALGEVVPAGEEIVEITVACTGRVADVFALGGAEWPPSVSACVADALHYAAFPAHALPDGATFMVPIRFTDAGKPGAPAPPPPERVASAWARGQGPSSAEPAVTSGPGRRSQSAVKTGQLSESGPLELSAIEPIALPTLPDRSTDVAVARPPAPRPSVAVSRPPVARPPARPVQSGDACDRGDAAACYALAKIQAADRDTRKSVARATLTKGCSDAHVSPQACFLLGVYQEAGVGGDRDRTDASLSFRRACAADHAQSCYRRGVLLAAGVGVRRDETAALGAHERACTLGITEACVAAGALVERGTTTARDPSRAQALYGAACTDADPVGCTQLGRLRADSGDPTGARDALERGVELGSPESMRRLAALLWTGLGGPKAKGRAKDLCRDGCQAGDAKACSGPALQ